MSDKKAPARDVDAIVYGGVPRVNLMPPEVAQARKDARTKRSLGALVIVVLVLTAGGIAAATWWAGQAQARLDDARAETLRLQEERLQYTEVTQVLSRLDAIRGQREALAAGEIIWRDVLEPYLAIVEADGIVLQFQASGVAPGAEPLGVSGPLRDPRVATVRLTVETEGVPDASGWLRSFATIESLADASVDTISGDPETPYSTTLTINLNDAAFSGRFASEEADQ